MTSTIFFEWLLTFNTYIGASADNRKVVLLLESCTTHGTPETLPQLEHVTLFFLPVNRASKFFPMDGIILEMTAENRKRQ